MREKKLVLHWEEAKQEMKHDVACTLKLLRSPAAKRPIPSNGRATSPNTDTGEQETKENKRRKTKKDATPGSLPAA